MSRFAETVYRFLLLAFPADFRHRHADGMVEQLRAQRRSLQKRPVAIALLWTRAILDVLRHGMGERFHRRERFADAPSAAGPSVVERCRNLVGDLGIVFRGLRRQPGFTLTAVATLALGIGANAAVFALAWHTTFRPLPYPHPEQLIRIFESNPTGGQTLTEVSPASLRAWAERATTIEAIGDFSKSRIIFPRDDDGAMARTQMLSPGALKALRAQPILGRIVLDDAERQPREALISYDYWQRRFGGDPSVIGRLHHFADVADIPDRIIGVMPPGFQYLEPADIWSIGVSYSTGVIGRGYRSLRQDSALARVRPGSSVADARAEIERISADLAREFPDTHAGWVPVVRPLHDTVVGEYAVISWLLVGAAATVFLVACLNIGGLLVMRAFRRSADVRLRLAMGASRWQVVRLWLLEAVVLAGAGSLAGLTAANWLLIGLKTLAPAGLARVDEVTISLPVVAVVLFGIVAFVVLYTFAPVIAGVLSHTRTRLGGSGQRTTSSGGPSGRWSRGFLLATQAGLAAVLLSGAVLFTSALQHLYAEPLGFDPSDVLTVRVALYNGGNRRPWAQYAAFGRDLEDRLNRHPGVAHAAVSSLVPMDGGIGFQFYGVEDDPQERRWGAIQESSTPGYLETLGLTLKSGRWFTDADRFSDDQLTTNSALRDHSAVITESMATALWPNESPLGKRLIPVISDSNAKIIVGVVGDLKFQSPDQPPNYRIFVPWYQRPVGGNLAILAKAKGDPLELERDIDALVRKLRPDDGVHAGRLLTDLVSASSASTSFATGLVGGFSLLALLLTGIGVFGVVGYSIAARRRELAVRMALGARRRDVSLTAATSAVVPILVGTGVGLVAALGSVHFVRGLLFEVNPLSPSHYLVAGALLLTVAAMAAALPLRRVTTIDPAESLRAE